MEANVIMAKCPVKGNSSYGIRVEKRGSDWVSTWAFAIDDARASREGFDKSDITGTFAPVDKFPGCPHCGTEGLMQCGCGKLICYEEGREKAMTLICPWCSEQIGNISMVDSAEVSSGGDG
jgi:hypothetical protein